MQLNPLLELLVAVKNPTGALQAKAARNTLLLGRELKTEIPADSSNDANL